MVLSRLLLAALRLLVVSYIPKYVTGEGARFLRASRERKELLTLTMHRATEKPRRSTFPHPLGDQYPFRARVDDKKQLHRGMPLYHRLFFRPLQNLGDASQPNRAVKDW